MLIRVTNGTLGYVVSEGESVTVQVKRRGDQPFEIEDREALRLIKSGNVEAVTATGPSRPLRDEAAPETGKNLSKGEIPTEGKEEAHLDPDQLQEMTLAELKELAGDMGLDISGCKKKSDIIDLIAAENVDAGDDGEAPPDLNAEAPVV